MDGPTVFHENQPSRRDLLRVAACGATAVLGGGFSRAQAPAGESRRIIDVHQHFVSPDYLAFLAKKRMGGGPQWKDYSPAKHVEDMDKASIATSMISPTAPAVWFGDVEESRRVAREINEYGAKMAGDYKGRFGLFAALPFPDVDGSLKEIEYAFETLKAEGVGILTSYDNNKWLGDKAFAPIFDELNRRKAVVYTHPLALSCCGNLVEGVAPQVLEYPSDTTRAIMSLIVGGTATRCPDIKFIFSHAGGTIVSVAGRFLGPAGNGDNITRAGEPNSRLYHLKRFYYDTAQSTNPVLMQALKVLVPSSQIVYGSDFPFANAAAQAMGLQSCGLSADELRGIYRENALKLLPRRA